MATNSVTTKVHSRHASGLLSLSRPASASEKIQQAADQQDTPGGTGNDEDLKLNRWDLVPEKESRMIHVLGFDSEEVPFSELRNIKT